MVKVPPIIDLEKIIESHLRNRQLLSYKSSYLTQPGENYGSLMLNIVAKLKSTNKDGREEEEKLNLVAKLPPITNELFWTLFQPQRTCVTENAVYKYLAPAMNKLQIMAGISKDDLFDPFPAYYGSRLSLKDTGDCKRSDVEVDKNAVLLQENLLKSGYKAGIRLQMFDLVCAQFIIKNMAKFHALGVGLRLKNPQQFEKDIKPFFRRFDMNKSMTKEVKGEFENDLREQLKGALELEANNFYIERVMELLEGFYRYSSGPEIEDDLYTTITHNDLWINNIMLKYDKKGEPNGVKFVDFQISQYDNGVRDLIFFLFSSCETQVLDSHFDKLLYLYYTSFIDCLKSLDTEYAARYTYASLVKDIYCYGPIEVVHALFMSRIILAGSDTMPNDFKDMDMSVLRKNATRSNVLQRTSDILHLADKYRFLKRN